jgi:hypothetical protein
MEYDIPPSNPYTVSQHGAITVVSGEGKEPEYTTADVRPAGREPVYAAPDEMNVFTNSAYGTTRIPSWQANIYSSMDIPQKKSDAISTQTNRKTENEGRAYQKILCCAICMLSFFISIGLASATLAVVLLPRSNTPQSCNCTQNIETQNMLGNFQARLDQTSRELEDSRQETIKLASLVTELSFNTSALLAPLIAPTVETIDAPGTNITNILHNCTTTVESQCLILPGQKQCVTDCAPEREAGSVAINFQCTRLQTEEPNPLIATLDVKDGEAVCLCYVAQINNIGQQSHPVECALRVTRCTLTNSLT